MGLTVNTLTLACSTAMRPSKLHPNNDFMSEFNKFIEQENPINNDDACTTSFVPATQRSSSNESLKNLKKPSTKRDLNDSSLHDSIRRNEISAKFNEC